MNIQAVVSNFNLLWTLFWVLPRLSVLVIVKFLVVVISGVPLMVLPLKLKPNGKRPDVRVYVYGAVPPVREKVARRQRVWRRFGEIKLAAIGLIYSGPLFG